MLPRHDDNGPNLRNCFYWELEKNASRLRSHFSCHRIDRWSKVLKKNKIPHKVPHSALPHFKGLKKYSSALLYECCYVGWPLKSIQSWWESPLGMLRREDIFMPVPCLILPTTTSVMFHQKPASKTISKWLARLSSTTDYSGQDFT